MDLIERSALTSALNTLPDECLVDAEAVALLMGLSAVTIRQRRNPAIPRPLAGLRVLRWRLGDVRQMLRGLQVV